MPARKNILLNITNLFPIAVKNTCYLWYIKNISITYIMQLESHSNWCPIIIVVRYSSNWKCLDRKTKQNWLKRKKNVTHKEKLWRSWLLRKFSIHLNIVEVIFTVPERCYVGILIWILICMNVSVGIYLKTVSSLWPFNTKAAFQSAGL